MQNDKRAEFLRVWRDALLLKGFDDLELSGAQELSAFTGEDLDLARRRLRTSVEDFATLWRESSIDPSNEKAVTDFYNKGLVEAYELMRWHCIEPATGPLGYVAALRLAQRHGARTYLDYGSGIGSGGLLFARHGFDAWLCDIAKPLLDFSRWRFDQRGLVGHFVDIRHEQLAHGAFDLITCFDVLEHVKDPLRTLREIRELLSPDGVVVVRCPFGTTDERPMHLAHPKDLWKRFRRVGFNYLWDEMRLFERSGCGDLMLFMKKSSRNFLRRGFYSVYDSRLLDGTQQLLGKWRVR